MGQVYMLEIIFKEYNKRYKKVIIYDSYKKLPFSVANLAKAFNLPISKLEIDYNKKRKIGYKLTKKEIEYLKNDVTICAMALDIQFKNGLRKMTIGSDALFDFKHIFTKSQFIETFPIFSLKKHNDLKGAYKGGFTYLNPKYKNKEIKTGIVFDVNSLYPYVMREKPLQIGNGIFFNGKYVYDERYPLYIQKITTKFKIKKGRIPTIQLKNITYNPEYVTNSKDEVTLILTNIDLELFIEQYNPDYIEYDCGYKFKAKNGLFNEYIDKWSEIKINNDGAIRTLAKLMLNSLYGKFGTNPDVTMKIPYLDDESIVRYKLGDENFRKPIYVPVASFITSYARNITIRTAQSLYDRFIYADTDSVHLIGDEIPTNIEIHPSKLGAWKHEYTFQKAKFIKAKTYLEIVNDELIIKGAGITNNIKEQITWENFNQGSSFVGNLKQKRTQGGVVLVDDVYTIK